MIRQRVGFWLCVLVWLSVGCSDPESTDTNCPEACPSGQMCVEGACRDADACVQNACACASDTDCPDAQRCVDQMCTAVQIDMPDPVRGTPADACPSGAFDTFGICLPAPPAPPQLTPPEGCPGEIGEEGICAPQLPRFETWTCPEGWKRVEALDPEDAALLSVAPMYCEPPQVAPLPDCAPGTMPLVGQEECVNIGHDCPENGAVWHSEEVLRARAPGYDGAVVYVHSEADPKRVPDGTRALPFSSIAQALEAVNSNGIVAVGVGEYDEDFGITTQVAVVGSCTEATSVVGPTSDGNLATVRISSPRGFLLSDIRVTGDRRGVAVGDIRGGRIQSVWIERATEFGMLIISAQAFHVVDVFISDTQPKQSDRSGGIGLQIVNGADATIERTSLVRNHTIGVQVGVEGTRATMIEVLSADTLPQQSDRRFGRGLNLLAGGFAQVERSVFVRNHNLGISATNPQTQLHMIDSFVSDTKPKQRDQSFGHGVSIELGAEATIERTSFLRNHAMGVQVRDAGSSLTLRDALVSDTRLQQSDMKIGRGLRVGLNAVAHIERASFLRNDAAGVTVDKDGAEATLTDIFIADTQPDANIEQEVSGKGSGLFVFSKATVSIERAYLTRNQTYGAFIVGESESAELQPSATLKDISISNTKKSSALSYGSASSGLLVTQATVVAKRVASVYNHSTGFFVVQGVLDAEDIIATDSQTSQAFSEEGAGLEVSNGVVNVNRALFARNQASGVAAIGEQAHMTMTDIYVSDTQAHQRTMEGGAGIYVLENATAHIERASIGRNQSTGILLSSENSSATLRDIEIFETQPEQGTQNQGIGLGVQAGARLEVERASILRNHAIGIKLTANSTVELTDVVVGETKPQQSDMTLGSGINISSGSVLRMERASVLHNSNVGVVAALEGTQLTMVDVRISETQPQKSDGDLGIGLSVQDQATAEVERAVFANNHQVGVLATDANTQLNMTDIVIAGTLPVIDRLLQRNIGGNGMSVVLSANVVLERFSILDNALIGLQIARQASIQANNGVIKDNFIGLNTQDVDIDFGESLQRVDIQNNCCGNSCAIQVCNIESQDIPIPTAADAISVVDSVEP